MAPKRRLSEAQEQEQKQVIETLESLGFTQHVISFLEERINSEEEDQDISMLYPYLPLLQELVGMIPVSHVAITLCNNKEKLDFIIEHIDSQNNMRLQIINAQGYKNAIAILRDNESLLKQMKQTTSLISILNMLRENKDLIRHYITLGFTPESMGLILFIQRTQLKYTFKILDDNKSLFANKLEHFSEDKLTAHLLEQNDKIETFGMRVELLKTGQASRSLSVTSAAVRRILSSQRTEQIPNRDSRINFSPRSFRN